MLEPMMRDYFINRIRCPGQRKIAQVNAHIHCRKRLTINAYKALYAFPSATKIQSYG